MKVLELVEFSDWLEGLRDINAKARILVRLRRFGLGMLGDYKAVSRGVLEARIDYGPGYRLYFVKRGDEVIVMLGGGTKKGQQRDIERANKLAQELIL